MVEQTGIAVNSAFGSTGPRGDGPEEGEVVCPPMDADGSPVSDLKELFSFVVFSFALRCGNGFGPVAKTANDAGSPVPAAEMRIGCQAGLSCRSVRLSRTRRAVVLPSRNLKPHPGHAKKRTQLGEYDARRRALCPVPDSLLSRSRSVEFPKLAVSETVPQ
jgi:hypothetical protein